MSPAVCCQWLHLCLDLASLVTEIWQGQTYKSIDSICISANCKLRRIYTTRHQLVDTTDDEGRYITYVRTYARTHARTPACCCCSCCLLLLILLLCFNQSVSTTQINESLFSIDTICCTMTSRNKCRTVSVEQLQTV